MSVHIFVRIGHCGSGQQYGAGLVWGNARTKNPIDALIAFYHAGQDNPLFNGGAISVLAYILSALLGSPGDKICVLFVLFLVIMWLMGWDMLDLKDWVCRAGGFLRNLLFPTKDALPAEEDVPDLEEPKRIGFFSNLFHKAEEQEQEAEAVQLQKHKIHRNWMLAKSSLQPMG